MVVKKCPECDQTLPVACKSCPCGHVFISRKQQTPEKPDYESFPEGVNRDKRLRPEIPKREIQDFEYGYTLEAATLSRKSDEEHMVTIKLPLPAGINTGTQIIAVGAPVPTLNELQLPEDYLNIHGKRKRGRPKGSKNKPKRTLLSGKEMTQHENTSMDNQGLGDKRRRGRPKGSKNKPKDAPMFAGTSQDGWSSDQQDYYKEPLDVMRHISKEKAVTYSIVLSDINQKMMKQSSMNFV